VTSDRRPVAEALVAAQRWESARVELAAALANDPDDAHILGLMVRTLRALGERQQALDASQHLLSLTPRDPYALRLGTLVLLDVGWVDEAIGLARRAVEQDPGNAANHLALSRAWADSSRPEAVDQQLAAAREAVLLEPNSVDAQLQIGTALSAEGDSDAARAAYHEALRQDPGNTSALNNLAVLEMQAGSPAEAARHLAAALAANPHGVAARRNLDTLAVVIARRAGRWLLLAPVPALVAAASGYDLAARVLALLAVAGIPVAGVRWWRALSAGQRRAMRGLTRRVRPAAWAWPVGSAVVGGWALVRAGVWPEWVTMGQLVVYLLVMMTLIMVRAASSTPLRTRRARAARRSSDVGRVFGNG
jgi:tetratricopeptide (TPR) repeat protein